MLSRAIKGGPMFEVIGKNCLLPCVHIFFKEYFSAKHWFFASISISKSALNPGSDRGLFIFKSYGFVDALIFSVTSPLGDEYD